MRWTLSLAFARAVMVLLVALGLLTAGFSHRPVQTAAQIDQAVYLAEMGLTLADLCAGPGAGTGGGDMDDCPVCHLAASVLVPEPVASVIDLELRSAAAILVPASVRLAGRVSNPATPVRAPPLA